MHVTHSVYLFIWKVQIKTMMRYRLTPVRIVIIKTKKNLKSNKLTRMRRNWNSYSLLVGM